MNLRGLVNPNSFFPVRWLYPGLTWKIPVKEKILYFTFDDGPAKDITPWVLSQLKEHKAKATFFCVGENVKENPGIFSQVQSEGHGTGNHTYHHLNGWKTPDNLYLDSVQEADALIGSTLFRPPYGKATRSQYRALRKKYSIIMWDVLSYDFETTISGEKCLSNILSNAQPGSIIVMHDSEKARPNLEYVLPKALKYFSERGFRFEAIPEET